MKEEFVAYEQALALKELGFDEPCFGYFEEPCLIILKNNEVLFLETLTLKSDNFKIITAPTFSQAFKWFREKYNLIPIIVQKRKDKGVFYGGYIDTCDDLINHSFGSNYLTYSKAEFACLNELIKTIKK